jgi:predicted lipoprotein with Yx(FWY)xxD motif
MKYNIYNTWVVIIIVIAAAAVVLAGIVYLANQTNPAGGTGSIQPQQNGQMQQNVAPAASAPVVQINSKNNNNFLADANGMTLYIFANDLPLISNCTGSCAAIWPPFLAPQGIFAVGLDPADFGIIARSDGTKQTTYKGWPLYRYSGDAAPGETAGDNFNGLWFIARTPFYTVILKNSPLGIHLADGAGRSLYFFANDAAGSATAAPASACSGVCAQNWPPFDSGGVTIVPLTLNSADFTEFTRADGIKQAAYKDKPLYYYSKDVNPGDMLGNGSNSIWFLAKP